MIAGLLPPSTALAHLADLPRWVEPRSLLRLGACTVQGVLDDPAPALTVRDEDGEVVFVIGQPPDDLVRAAVGRAGREVIAAASLADRLAQLLPGWTRAPIVVHTLPERTHLPVVPAGLVTALDPGRIAHLAVDEDLREELSDGAAGSLILAALVAGEPVSFCYAGAVTEHWWDVAIDTVPSHRRRGYAGLVAAAQIARMDAEHKQPVWQALADNPASMGLAAKLGFTPVDALVMFERP